MSIVLSVENLCKTFNSHKDEFKAVDNVSFNIHDGEIISLLGPNGAGKTTIVSMVGGYLLPTSGKIIINGEDRYQNKFKTKVGVVLGGELGFYGRATALDNLMFFADLAKVPRRERRSEALRVLDLVELKNVANKKVQFFSKGMKQRLHIARALLGNPPLLLLDEPTSGLDVEISVEIHKIIKQLANSGVAILLTSHTMTEIESLSDEVLLIGAGKIFSHGTVKDIISESDVHHIDRPATLEESYLAIASKLRRP
ncbi:ABC transporter ATP-binding protein [Companilactobacillus hulinensis]|uniref:ABC transporter ATP-binding protein n=1 Tax=Companilactobacillus hulinensis TaxID=2486007 RepID=UPI000F775E31|nr:ABC transporter ATP-binding protein [Companilactobacillus hulinensis]